MTQSFVPLFCSIADKMVSKISANHSSGDEFDMIYYTERCLVETLLATSFHIFEEDVDNGEEKIEYFVNAVRQ
jgi:hypothetical protein